MSGEWELGASPGIRFRTLGTLLATEVVPATPFALPLLLLLLLPDVVELLVCVCGCTELLAPGHGLPSFTKTGTATRLGELADYWKIKKENVLV